MKFLLFIIAVCFSFSASAQFFGKLQPPVRPVVHFNGSSDLKFGGTVVTDKDSTFPAFRPIVMGGITLGNDLTRPVAGTGISYQNITYTYPVLNPDGTVTPGRSYCNWAISALALAGGSIAGTDQTDMMSYGLMISFLNNNLGAGIAASRKKATDLEPKSKWVFGPIFTFGINFNN